ncbi:DUF86 domain-containing protein [Leptolyngbyaceae cyanobacterium CCMR0082]|uniref:DUF86 domain-containing protein n=1 Tax=Adonisia turfae CCMR0082 TaxID=2304604 RepID=A0A6M0SGU1_9CYAN|nr:HepT-like ribonuclease domain-containing protein [Adonisia turfae]NEZ67715.1 DUF86 domain-containing protein [Adonisia turfae CCMR0082]
MTPHWLAHAIHILASTDLIQETVHKSMGYFQEPMLYRGILRTLHTLFESAYKLPDDIKAQHPSLPWQDFRDLRNILVHDYLGDFTQENTLEIIDQVLPALREAMLMHVPNWDEIKNDYQL